MKRAALITFLALLAGCAQPEKKPAETPAFRALGQPVEVDATRNDEAIGFEVRRRLELIGAADTAGIIVEVSEGVVTLSGSAPSTAAAWRAEGAARAVEGVKAVVNHVVPRNVTR